MDPLVTVHLLAAVALVVLAALVGLWGLARTRQLTDSTRVREARAFAQVLQLSHTLVLAVGLLGLALLVEGNGPDDPLHARVYGPFMLVAIIAAYAYRTKVARTNVRVFAIASLVVCALGLRALATGG